MQKLIVDGKEVEFDKNNLKPLSEEELEHAHGGTGENGRYYSRIVCLDCGYAGRWSASAQEDKYMVNIHYSQTGHYQFKTEGGYFTSNPDETTTG